MGTRINNARLGNYLSRVYLFTIWSVGLFRSFPKVKNVYIFVLTRSGRRARLGVAVHKKFPQTLYQPAPSAMVGEYRATRGQANLYARG